MTSHNSKKSNLSTDVEPFKIEDHDSVVNKM
jgi:hypothetical protein